MKNETAQGSRRFFVKNISLATAVFFIVLRTNFDEANQFVKQEYKNGYTLVL